MPVRPGRLVLLGGLAVLILGAAATVILVRRALDGGSIRAAAEARLSAHLGEPVTIGGMALTWLPRPAIAGSEVTVGHGSGTAPGIEIQRITVIPRLRSLLRGPVVIEDVRLEGFVVSVLRDRQGGWHVPAAVPAPTAGPGDGLVVRRVLVTSGRLRVFNEAAGGIREASSLDDVEAEVVSAGEGLRLSPVTGRIGTARIRGEATTDATAAHLAFSSDAIADGDLPALLGLIGSARPGILRLHAPAAGSVALTLDRGSSRLSATGTVRAADVGLEPLRLQALDAAYTLHGSQLVLQPTAFRLYGGTHRGTVTVDLSGAPPRWQIDSRVTALDLGSFLNALTATDARIDGTAAAAGALHGRLGAALADTVEGRAELNVTDGVIRQFPLLAAIDAALHLTESDSRDTRFERLSATLTLGNGRAATDDLVLLAGHIRVEAAGLVGFNRSLSLRGRAILSQARTAAAIRSVDELSALRNDNGELVIPLTIGGTLDAPAFGLDVKAVIGRGIADELKRRLRGFIKR